MRVSLTSTDVELLCKDNTTTLLKWDDEWVHMDMILKDGGIIMYYLTDRINQRMRTDHLTAEDMADLLSMTLLQPYDYEKLFKE